MEPNPLAIFLLCVAGAAALMFLLWLNHKLRTRQRPKSDAEEEAPALVSRRIAAEAPAVTRPLISEIMSLLLGSAGPIERPATPLPAPPRRLGKAW